MAESVSHIRTTKLGAAGACDLLRVRRTQDTGIARITTNTWDAFCSRCGEYVAANVSQPAAIIAGETHRCEAAVARP